MNAESILKQILTLPPEIQKEVADYVAFLSEKYADSSSPRKAEKVSVLDSPFVGYWASRKDLKDSARWVRTHRKQDWE